MGLDVSEGMRQVLAAAQRPVHDEQVATCRYTVHLDHGPCLGRRDHFDLGQMTLEGLGEPDHERRAGALTYDMTCSVIACQGDDVAGVRCHGEKAAPYVGLDEVGLLAAAARRGRRSRHQGGLPAIGLLAVPH